MTSRSTVLGALVVAAATSLVLTSCGGNDSKPRTSAGPDRSSFVEITDQGLAAVVDKHLGDRVESYSAYADSDPGGKTTQRTLEVTLNGVDRRDTFSVTVYAPGKSEGQVVTGGCDDSGAPADPQARVTCSPAPQGGNVTITQFSFGLSEGNRKGSYLTASGTGPDDREVTAAYESFTKKVPLSDKVLSPLLADPYLGWKTDPKFNKAGESLEVTTDEG